MGSQIQTSLLNGNPQYPQGVPGGERMPANPRIARELPCQGRGRGFEPLRPLQIFRKTPRSDEGPLTSGLFVLRESSTLH